MILAVKPDYRVSHDALGLTFILLIALVVRAVAWSQTAVMFNDGPIFLAMSEAVAEGRWAEVLAHPYHPLYPSLIALVGRLPIELETAAVTVSILGGLLGIGALFWFVRDAFGNEVGWLAAWLAALHPWFVDFSADVMSDGLYIGLFLLGFAVLARVVDRPSLANSLVCGAIIGLAYLVRPEGAGLLVVGVLLLAARGCVDRTRWPSVMRAVASLLLAGAVVIVPFVLAVGQETGEFVLTQKKSFSRLVGVVDQVERAAPAIDRISDALPLPEWAIRADGEPSRRPERSMNGSLEAISRVAATSMAAFRFELIPLALLGLWATRSNRNPWREATLGLPIVLYSGLLVLLVWGVGYVGRRHALAFWLPVLGLSALGWRFLCSAIADWGDARGGSIWVRLRTPRAATLALVVVLVLSWGARDLRARRFDRAPVREAAEWLSRTHPESGLVAAQKLRTAYYAGARFVPLPSGHDGLLRENLQQRTARWVVIDDTKLDDHLGLEEGLGKWLHPIHVVPSEGRKILVLAVDGAD